MSYRAARKGEALSVDHQCVSSVGLGFAKYHIIDLAADGSVEKVHALGGGKVDPARRREFEEAARRDVEAKRERASAAAMKAQAAQKEGAGAPAPAAPRRERSMSSVATEMVVAGKTNAEVFTALQEEFALPDSKRSYPAWYRNNAIKKGLVTKEFAKAHAGESGAIFPKEVKEKLAKAKAAKAKAPKPSREDVRAAKDLAASMSKAKVKAKRRSR